MNTTILTRDGMRVIGTSAVVRAATLAALLAVFVLAKPSEAEDPILTINPSSVDFGNVTVGANPGEQNGNDHEHRRHRLGARRARDPRGR